MERHDDSPDPIHDRLESVSDASQNVADGGGVCDLSFPNYSPVSIPSSPWLDDEDGNRSSINSQTTGSLETMNGSMSSQLSSLTPSPRVFDDGVIQPGVPVPMANGGFMCPKCPRTFTGLSKAWYVSLANGQRESGKLIYLT